MKFLALKEALESAPLTAVPAPRQPQPIPFYNPAEKKQSVVGGDILRSPVDKTAAMVTSKCPWWAHAPHQETEKPKTEPRKKKRMNAQTMIADAQAIKDATTLMEHELDRVKLLDPEINKAIDRIGQVKGCLLVGITDLALMWDDLEKALSKRIEELRTARMAIGVETKQLISPLGELRHFFLTDKHEEEMRRLTEFVELCERLEKLKTSGFLEAVADTIIKLS